MKETTVFRHVIGKSSLREGITIHKDFEDWFESPESGAKKEITLIYDADTSLSVTLRRLNNKARHVQIKYETTRHSRFREWLQAVFRASTEQTIGEILEFHKIRKDEYLVKPLTREIIDGANLRISKTFYHGGSQNIIPYVPVFEEVSQTISEVGFRVGGTQAYYNQQLKKGFVERGWATDKPVIEDLNLRYDFTAVQDNLISNYWTGFSYLKKGF